MAIILGFAFVTLLTAFVGRCAIDKLVVICTLTGKGDQGPSKGGTNLRTQSESKDPHKIICDSGEIREDRWAPLTDTSKYQGDAWDQLRGNIVRLLQNELQCSKLISWLETISTNDYDYTMVTRREPEYTRGALPQYYMDVLEYGSNYKGAKWMEIRSFARALITTELQRADAMPALAPTTTY